MLRGQRACRRGFTLARGQFVFVTRRLRRQLLSLLRGLGLLGLFSFGTQACILCLTCLVAFALAHLGHAGALGRGDLIGGGIVRVRRFGTGKRYRIGTGFDSRQRHRETAIPLRFLGDYAGMQAVRDVARRHLATVSYGAAGRRRGWLRPGCGQRRRRHRIDERETPLRRLRGGRCLLRRGDG